MVDNFAVADPIVVKVHQVVARVADNPESDSEDDVAEVPWDFLEDSMATVIVAVDPLDSVLVVAALAMIEARDSPYY